MIERERERVREGIFWLPFLVVCFGKLLLWWYSDIANQGRRRVAAAEGQGGVRRRAYCGRMIGQQVGCLFSIDSIRWNLVSSIASELFFLILGGKKNKKELPCIMQRRPRHPDVVKSGTSGGGNAEDGCSSCPSLRVRLPSRV